MEYVTQPVAFSGMTMSEVAATVPTGAHARSSATVRLDTSLELLLKKAPTDETPRILATVVATAGSTYRKPGARMLVMADGSYLGLLSGGCLEADLKLHAADVLSSGKPRAIEYDMRGPDDILFGVGAGCQGAMRVLLEPAGPGTPAYASIRSAGEAVSRGEATSLVIIHQSSDLALGTYCASSPVPETWKRAAERAVHEERSHASEFDHSNPGATRTFIQYIAPVPRLLICGAGPDAQPVAAFATALGWRVTVFDHRAFYARAERFPDCEVLSAPADELGQLIDLTRCHAVLVMSHHLESDAVYLRALSRQCPASYIGLLGPKARRERVLQEAGAETARIAGSLHGPVGFDVGSQTPEGIALATIGQIHAVLAGRNISPEGFNNRKSPT